jgi:hypothetical protein
MHAATVELLVSKAHLEPDIAVAFAEAIDMAVTNAQLVTVPVFDARFGASEARIDARFSAFEARIDARFVAFEARMDARFNEQEAKLDAKLEKLRAELVRWVYVGVVGNFLASCVVAILAIVLHGH